MDLQKETGLYNPYNFFDEFKWMKDKYYKQGSLVSHAGALCTEPIKLFPGAVIDLSSFHYVSQKGDKGVRVSFWKDKQWESDIGANITKNLEYVTIPENCNEISLTFLAEEPNKYVHIFGNQIVDDSKVILALIRQNYEINERFEGKTVSILGDSVSTFGGTYTTDAEGNKWSDGVYTFEGNRVRYPQGNLTNVNDTWWMRLINKNHMKLLVNDSWAGSRVSWDGTEENAKEGKDIHMASTTRIEHLKTEEVVPDIIFVFGGSNDIINNVPLYMEKKVGSETVVEDLDTVLKKDIKDLTVSTFADAYRTMLIRIQDAYPNTKIYCILPYLITENATLAKINVYNKVMKEICDYLGVETIDARQCGMTAFHQSEYRLDNVHLNKEGMKLLFEQVNRI